MRGRSLGVWLVCLGMCAAGCDVRDCTAADCSGPQTTIELVDDTGELVLAKGEYHSRGRGFDSTISFDCSLSRADSLDKAYCDGGQLSVGAPTLDFESEIRFELADGELTDWQPIALDVSSMTDPDFNGPGCSCTWYVGTADPVVVPAAARP